MANTSISDVQAVYGDQEPAIDSTSKSGLITAAETLTEQTFGARIAKSNEIEGDEDQFATYLAAHLWEITEGGEPQSASQTGGSVSFDHNAGRVESTLAETRFGRVCLLMLRDQSSIGIVRADF